MTSMRHARNERTREQIASIVATTPSGTIIKTEGVLQTLKSFAHNYRCNNLRQVGRLLKERDDVEFVARGTWRVV